MLRNTRKRHWRHSTFVVFRRCQT